MQAVRRIVSENREKIMKQSRSISSLLNAITAMGLTLINGLMGIVATRLIIEAFGSDFNGLNSTANQIVNVLLILEGGFTMASNVALFAPLTQGDYPLANGILSATRNKFKKMGGIFFLVGVAVAVLYGLVANSALPEEFISTVILMTVAPAAFNLYYATTYRVLLQTQQKEYIINIITICTIGLGHLANIVMISCGGPMWMVRFNTMVFAFANSFMIAGYVKKKTPYLDLKQAPRAEMIQGTGDVMVQKITGVIYNSAPIVFLSISATGGTALASVYAVYNNVFTMVKSLLHSVIDAPRLSFGQMLTERKKEDVWSVFAQYEFAAFSAVFVLLTSCCVLILPFVSLYTDGITDINYYDVKIALLMVGISALEMLHIPSGHLINMAGKFRISRDFQLIACVVLVIGMVVGGAAWGIYGMLASILLVAVLLCVLEMGYIHTCFFSKKILALLRMLLPLGVTGVVLCAVEMQLNVQIDGYIEFLLYGVLFACLNSVAALVVGFLFNRRELMAIIRRIRSLIKI